MSGSKSCLARCGLVAVLAASGCGLLGGGGSDGGDSPPADFAMGGGDGGGGGGQDLTAAPADLNGSFVAVDWQLITASLSGGMNNGFSINCDDGTLNATELAFTVVNGGGQTATTKAPCAAGASRGSVLVGIPDPTGPFTVSGAVVGEARSRSEKVKSVAPGARITIRVYAFGCDSQSCL